MRFHLRGSPRARGTARPAVRAATNGSRPAGHSVPLPVAVNIRRIPPQPYEAARPPLRGADHKQAARAGGDEPVETPPTPGGQLAVQADDMPCLGKPPPRPIRAPLGSHAALVDARVREVHVKSMALEGELLDLVPGEESPEAPKRMNGAGVPAAITEGGGLWLAAWCARPQGV